jgi:hypothetical protein
MERPESRSAGVVQDLLTALAAELPEADRLEVEDRSELISRLLSVGSELSVEEFLSREVARALDD